MYSGQNLNHIATYGAGAQFKDVSSFIEESIKIFYDEKQYATMSNINNCCGSSSIPHFLEMVLDKNNKVGCAISEFTGPQGKTSYIACNYSYTIILGHTVYESGPPGSGCQTGTNPSYPNLCSTSEYINPNQVF
jgi:Cysteine-rich secretory protein family